MSDFRDDTAEQRYEQDFADPSGEMRQVWADYADSGSGRAILHVEAADALRGSGAAGKFMQALADHARGQKTKLVPRCSYAVAWFKRHPDQGDVLA